MIGHGNKISRLTRYRGSQTRYVKMGGTMEKYHIFHPIVSWYALATPAYIYLLATMNIHVLLSRG